MRHNPFKIVDMFEEHMADYVGAPYAVAVDSCTSALFLSCKYLGVGEVIIPAKTYLSVPQSVIHAGGKVKFREQDWNGIYQLEPYPIWDAAKRLTSGMYIPGSFMCLSFHIKKHLKIGKGGMILTDNADAVKWFKQARYEGRNEVPYKKDDITVMGWNMYMTPVEAAIGLAMMQNYPEHMEDQPEPGGYRDLREFSIFKDIQIVE